MCSPDPRLRQQSGVFPFTGAQGAQKHHAFQYGPLEVQLIEADEIRVCEPDFHSGQIIQSTTATAGKD